MLTINPKRKGTMGDKNNIMIYNNKWKSE
jgi:hypothetical protein